MKLYKADIFIVKDTTDYISKAISNITQEGNKPSYSHVGMLYNNKWVIESYFDGVMRTDVSEFWNRYTDIVVCRVKNSIKFSKSKFLKDMKDSLCIDYPWWQIAMDFLLAIDKKILGKDNRKHYTVDYFDGMKCSEVVGYALLRQGLWVKKGILPCYSTPNDFYESNLFDKVKTKGGHYE
jgi:hypothetical protein